MRGWKGDTTLETVLDPGALGATGWFFLFYFVFPGCGVRVSECASPGGHCKALVRPRHAHRCTRLAGARVAHTGVAGGTCAWMHVRLRLRGCRANPTEPEARSAPQPPALPPASHQPGTQAATVLQCRTGMGWVLSDVSDVSLVTRGDPRSQEPYRNPASPGSAQGQIFKNDLESRPLPTASLPTAQERGSHRPSSSSHTALAAIRDTRAFHSYLSFPSRAKAGRVSWLAFGGRESKDLPRVKITSLKPRAAEGLHT